MLPKLSVFQVAAGMACLLMGTFSLGAQVSTPQPAPVELALLPDAPSALLLATESSTGRLPETSGLEDATSQFSGTPSGAIQPVRSGLPIVNGRPYRKPTVKDNLRYYESALFSGRAFFIAAVRSGIEQARDVPTGWGQDFPGYAQRYGSAYGEYAIDGTVRYGLSSALQEDLHYRICHHCAASDKLANAFLSEVTARHGVDGHRTFSATPLIADFSGPAVAYGAWYPPGYTQGDAARHAFLEIGIGVGVNVVREFFFDHDTKADKKAAAGAAAP